MNYVGYEDWKKWHEKDFGIVGPGASFYLDQIFRKLPKKKHAVLEIGFGNGEMLGYFQKKATR